jgi:hypothetical protein
MRETFFNMSFYPEDIVLDNSYLSPGSEVSAQGYLHIANYFL